MQSHDREESQYLSDWKEQHEQSLEDLFVPRSDLRGKEWTFPTDFYVRTEELQVLDEIKKHWLQPPSLGSHALLPPRKKLVLQGSPGVGRSEGTSSLTAKNDQLLQLIYLGGQERVTYIWDEGVRRTHAILAIKTLLVDIRDSETLFCIDGLTQSDPKKRRIHRTFWGFSVLVCTSLFSKKRRSNVTLCLLPFWSESDL
ncbi:hypothetical protein Gpo141_00014049 [Globisporangium polare]